MSGSLRSARHWVLVFALGLITGAPACLLAQHAPQSVDWRIEPSVGLLFDAYDGGHDGSTAGLLVGLQVARRVSGPFSAVAAVAVGSLSRTQ